MTHNLNITYPNLNVKPPDILLYIYIAGYIYIYIYKKNILII